MRHIRAEQTRPPLHPSTAPALCPYPVIPRVRSARGNPYPPSLPPSVREVSRPKAVTEGEICRGSAAAYGAMWASPPTHRLPKAHASHSGRQTRPPLHTPTERPPCFFSVIPRVRSARGNPSPFHVNSGQRPPPTFAAARQRRDLIIAHPPEGVSKEGGPQPSLFGRSRMGDFQGGRKIETSFPLEWRFWLLLSLLTKVTRRRQKKEKYSGRADPSAPTHAYRTRTLSLSCHSEPVLTLAWESAPRARRRGLPKTHQDLRPRRRSCPQFSYNISRATGR